MIETTFFSTWFLPSVLALIMWGMGMSLKPQDFVNIVRQPAAVLTGLFSQMVVLPLIAFGIASVSGLRPELQVGLVLIAICPGGAVSNLISHLLKGNLALCVSLTSVNSFLTVLTIPFILNIALAYFRDGGMMITLPFSDTLVHVLLITVIPAVSGILTARRFPEFAMSTQRPFKLAMPLLLAIAMVAAIFLEKKDTSAAISTGLLMAALPWALLLNVVAMFAGWVIAKFLGLAHADQLTIGVEVGLQNSGLAISIATSSYLLNNTLIAAPASVYALFSFFTAVIFGILVNGKNLSRYDFLPKRKS